jgi:dihydropteroate synthase
LFCFCGRGGGGGGGGGAAAAGAGRAGIALDPGIGFAKTAEQSLGLLRGLPQIVELGYPLVVGTSRKSFIGAVLDLAVDRRLEGTLASVAWAATHGAHIVRVHDVEAATRAVAVIDAIRSAQP